MNLNYGALARAHIWRFKHAYNKYVRTVPEHEHRERCLKIGQKTIQGLRANVEAHSVKDVVNIGRTVDAMCIFMLAAEYPDDCAHMLANAPGLLHSYLEELGLLNKSNK